MEGPAATVHDLLCPLSSHLKEWDMKVREQARCWMGRRRGRICVLCCTSPVLRPSPHQSPPPPHLQVDSLSGTIPTGTPACMPKLEEYDLSRNRLTGTIPADLGDMPIM